MFQSSVSYMEILIKDYKQIQYTYCLVYIIVECMLTTQISQAGCTMLLLWHTVYVLACTYMFINTY